MPVRKSRARRMTSSKMGFLVWARKQHLTPGMSCAPASARALPLLEALSQVGDDSGKQGEEDDHRYQLVQMLVEVGDRPAEEIAGERHGSDPADSTDDVVGGEPAVAHGPRSRDDRGEGPDDGH